jgi:DNA-binding CsgD family transcriptional regulator
LLSEESIETAADNLGVAYETARNMLKSIFQKTDTHRQGELVALLARAAKRESSER